MTLKHTNSQPTMAKQTKTNMEDATSLTTQRRAPQISKHITIPLCTSANHCAFLRVGLPLAPAYHALISLCVDRSCAACTTLQSALAKGGAFDQNLISIKTATTHDDDNLAHHVAMVDVPKLNMQLASRCVATSSVSLDIAALKHALQAPKPRNPLPHQARDLALIKTLIYKNAENKSKTKSTPNAGPRRVLSNYRMGSGKTALVGLFLQLECLPVAERALIVIVCSNTLIQMWVAEIQRFCAQVAGTMSEVHVIGYTEFHRLVALNPRCVADATVVVDEAHYFRNLTAPMVADVDAMQLAARLLILTGTPIVNHCSEIHGLLALLGKENATEAKKLGDAGKPVSLEFLNRALNDPDVLVLDYEPRLDPALAARFPRTERRIERVEMTWHDVLQYKLNCKKDTTLGHITVCTSNTNAYRVASRTGCNTASKVTRVVDFILALHAARRLPVMVYSNFRSKGLDLVVQALQLRAPTLRIAQLNGDTPGPTRQMMINAANAGKVDVQLISEAAGVGTNFSGGFHSIVLLEALENVQTQNQVENRVVRLDATPTLVQLELDSEHRDSGDGGDENSNSINSKSKANVKVKKVKASHAECITLVQMLSVFPKKPPTLTEARELSAEFATIVENHGVNVAAELVKFVKEECETVDERMVRQNDEKHAQIQSVLAALKHAASTHLLASSASSASSAATAVSSASADVSALPIPVISTFARPRSPTRKSLAATNMHTQAKPCKKTSPKRAR